MDRPSDLEPPDQASTDDASAADDASADDARRRLREQGIVAVEPDERIGVMLAPGERVVAVRRAISIERRKDARDPELALRGDLYVTTARLVYLGQFPFDVPLVEVTEAVLASGALRLVVGDGRGLEIRTRNPALLRVEIAAVREAARIAAAGPRPTVAARQATPPDRADS
ncbi:MAG: hypothetical protein MUQ32_12410 [Chloroflexi bacterium]|nr:hypothetical protein [Chloroflexota bacterium]